VAHAITLLADHKGQTTPKVSGDEYYVDFVCDVTNYPNLANGGVEITAESLGLSKVTTAMITGQESLTYNGVIMCEAATGDYQRWNGSAFVDAKDGFTLAVLEVAQATPAEETNADTTTYSFRMRAYGLL
tara:strand:+ start:1609 stop:1998 length:390 start_codon:yes stop_codon:yes gene_type:complete